MSGGKLLLYALGLLLAVVILGTVISIALAIIGLTLWVLRLLVTVAVIGGLIYALYKLYTLVSGRSSRTREYSNTTKSNTDSGVSMGESRVDELQQRYLDGEISEKEFERRLEHELDDQSTTHELRRERI